MTGRKLEEYTQEEFSFGVASWAQQLLASGPIRPESSPKAVLLGGQSGAGKTRLHSIFRQTFEKNVIVINGDEFRKSHPRFTLLHDKYGDRAVEYTAPWSGKITEALIDSLSKLSYNLIVEGTLRTSSVPMGTAELLRGRGYEVSLALMAVKPEISLISCQIRYEEMRIAGTTPRATDPAHHKKIVDEIVDNLAALEDSGLFSEIYLYTRDGACIYPAAGKTASEVLRERLFGPWSTAEEAHYEELKRRLDSLRHVETP